MCLLPVGLLSCSLNGFTSVQYVYVQVADHIPIISHPSFPYFDFHQKALMRRMEERKVRSNILQSILENVCHPRILQDIE